MADEDEQWRKLINSYSIDLPSDGMGPPDLEMNKPKKRGRPSAKKYSVQRIVTEIYVFTDENEKTVGTQTFQDLYFLGKMTGPKLEAFIINERNKHKNDES